MSCVEGMLTLDQCYKEEIKKQSLDSIYTKDRIMGVGKYGVVRKIVNKTTGIFYAAKDIKKIQLEKNWLDTIHHEIAILKKCKSHNIVELHEVFETSSHITLVFDFLEGGDLKRLLQNVIYLSETDTKTVIKQVLESVRTLHIQNIVHMDIKLANILLSKPNSFENMKLCDFGLSRWLEPGKVVRTAYGTFDYIPPEVLKRDPISTNSDIWSIGVMTYILLCGFFPFTSVNRMETAKNIRKGVLEFDYEPFETISTEAFNFIKSMLIVDPKMRATVDELLQHPWLTSVK